MTENVEIVRRLFEAVSQRDSATVLSLYSPDVEWDATLSPLGQVTGATTFRGHHGLRKAFKEWYEGWDAVEDEVTELIDAGDRVVVVATIRSRGRLSGLETEWKDYASVWTIRDGLITRVVWLASREDGLAEAGITDRDLGPENPR